MASSQQPETSQQNQSQESKQAEPPQSGGDKVRYDPVGYVQHHDERSTAGSDPAHDASLTAASTSFTDGTPDSDASSTETNRDADGDEDQKDGDTVAADEGDDAVDDSEDLDEETVFVRKSTSFYRRRQSTSDTRLQQVLGFPFRPLVRPLTISDIDSCEALENAAFSKEHAATREKFEYRLTTCPELCLGLFCTVPPSVAEEHGLDIATYKTAKPVETGRPNGSVSVLVAHVVSTKCAGDLVTDEAMDYPRNFKTNKGVPGPKGHQPQGHTVALHSLAVYPKLHGCGLGKLIVKAYLQHVKGAAVADRVSLICQDYLVRYYEKHGFQNVGKSPSQYGGGGWHDMTFVFGKEKPVTYGSGR